MDSKRNRNTERKSSEDSLKCVEYFCPRFQTCARAVLYCGNGHCLQGEETVPAAQCCLLPDKPFYIERKEEHL